MAASLQVAQETLDVKGKSIAEDVAAIVSDCEIDENACAICLNRIPISETAQPEGCDHVYCGTSLVHCSTYCSAIFSRSPDIVVWDALVGKLGHYSMYRCFFEGTCPLASAILDWILKRE